MSDQKTYPHSLIDQAVKFAAVRISQESDRVGTVFATEAARIIWEEIQRLEAKT